MLLLPKTIKKLHSSIRGLWHSHCGELPLTLSCVVTVMQSFLCRRCVVRISVTVVQRGPSVILFTQNVFPPHGSPSRWWRNFLPEGGGWSQVGKSSCKKTQSNLYNMYSHQAKHLLKKGLLEQLKPICLTTFMCWWYCTNNWEPCCCRFYHRFSDVSWWQKQLPR